MSISKLPRELMLDVANNLPTVFLSRLHRTCHSLHQFLGPVLTARITTENLASTVLASGITDNHLPTVHLALAHNAPWHMVKDRDCYSAVEHACQNGHTEIVAALIAHYGPRILSDYHNPNKTYYCHNNPLETALRGNNLVLTTLLLEHGLPANRIIWYRWCDKTPLDFAGKYGSAEIVELLIKYGADVLQDGRCLCYAVEYERWDVVKVLLRQGVWVWPPSFDWSDRFPLSSRSPEQIEAWVAGGIAYMDQHGYEGVSRSVAAREIKISVEEVDVGPGGT